MVKEEADLIVSIPNGKGKVSKIKQVGPRHIVSIPNGKGKEQYLVLCFHYTYYI